MELAKAIWAAPFWLIALAAIVYVGRSAFDAALKSRLGAIEKRVDASLAIKKGLRGHEQDELVEFRVAVEKWEYFLQSCVGDLTMRAETQQFEPADFHDRDSELFGAVRLTAVKASIFLRDPALENELLQTITTIRRMYYPKLETTMRELLEIQGQMLPYLTRLKLYEASGLKDLSVALNADEAAVLIGLRHRMTASIGRYAEGLIADYRPIAEQLWELKDKINVHIYRPLTTHAIDEPPRPAS